MGAQHLRSWRPGQSGNPTGRPAIPEYLRAIKSLTQGEVTKIVSKYGRMTYDELHLALERGDAPVIELTVAKIFARSLSKGDYQGLAFLLDRAIGKVPVIEPTDDETRALEELRELSDQELLRLVKEKIPELEQPK